jgi:type I restriction enzyme S subunit
MELKAGYKRTEVGVIPENWAVTNLGSCLIDRPSYGINAAAVPYSDRLPVYVRITDISEDGRFLPGPRVSVRSEMSGNYFLCEGDIVFARTGASVGKSYKYNPNDGPLVYAGFLIRVRPDGRKLLSSFAAAFVATGTYWRWVRLMSMRSGQPGINGNEFAQLPMPLPALPEQRAIAEALSDADALIESIDQLITKKRNLKQGAMQQLLSGQTRLPGFRGEWEVKRLGDLGSTYGGLTGKTKSDFGKGEAQYITFMNVMTNVTIDCAAFERVTVFPHESQNRAVKGDLFFNGSSETPEEVAMCAVLLEDVHDVYLNSFCFGFRCQASAEVDGVFFAYYLRSREGRELMKTLAQGSTRYNLSKVALLNSSLRLPTLPEQAAIATILNDMDTELAELESRLAKARHIKQGMMQELLTGRIRLL